MKRCWLGLLFVATGCSEAVLPERPDPYGFSIDCGQDDVECSASGGDIRLIFRWPRRSLPVRVWAETPELYAHAGNAIRTWMGASLYGEVSGALVSDSAFADVLVLLGGPEVITRVDDAPLDCRGSTPIAVREADTSMVVPFRITVHPRSGSSPDEISRCIDVVVAHEFGHALGLFQESGDPADLMYFNPRVDVLSPRDRVTFNTLYHVEPTVRLPAGR